jgi:uncharacterized protein YfiM (DUF2279 family)
MDVRYLSGTPFLAIAFLFAQDLSASAVDPDTTTFGACDRCMFRTGAAMGMGMVGTLLLLDQAWYASYERSPLHTFNDGNEWLQMDKAGHVFSAYTLSSWGTALFDRCDPPGRKALWLGSGLGLAFMTGVELLDGTSAAWGFSWWDMAANVIGTGLFVGQELAWSEQRIRLKLSARHTDYAAMRPELLGEGAIERYLKDYNGQTIWLSTNLHAFAPNSALPAWLNVGVGYSAVGMITAAPPPSGDALGGDLQRMRRYFLSPDIDLTRIKTRSKALRTVLFVLNSIKIPAPSLEVTSTGKVVGHWLYF